MRVKRVMIYFMADEESYMLGLSEYPLVEMKYFMDREVFWQPELRLLTEPLKWSVAYYIYQRISKPEERSPKAYRELGLLAKIVDYFWQIDLLAGKLEDKKIMLCNSLKKFSLMDKLWLEKIEFAQLGDVNLPDKIVWKQLYQLLQGRSLYKSEIRELLQQNGLVIKNLERALYFLKVSRGLEVMPAVEYDNFIPSCKRCGSTEVVKMDCIYCQESDYYCKSCLLMGEARGCRALYKLKLINLTSSPQFISPQLEFELTPLQSEISKKLSDFLQQDKKSRALVWAVCGAGKTEVTFKVIANTLNQGGKVLFAIPRRDVVVELEERLKEAFPEVKIKGLYGGSSEKYRAAELVVATVHQLIRYYQAFDLVILDEMDAFPYQGNQLLKRSLEGTLRQAGKLVYLTATPSSDELKKFSKDDAQIFKLSARYHGHPLPEPELITANIDYDLKKESVTLTTEIIELLRDSVEEKSSQVFVFVPFRELVRPVVLYLRQYFPEVNGVSWVQGSHSQDEERELKRQGFSDGNYPILVATTIMERGITVPQADVMVLFAETDYIFMQQSLVQMAGRSGRSLEYPTGNVWFIGRKISEAMKEARDNIKDLNADARKRGYIRAENSE